MTRRTPFFAGIILAGAAAFIAPALAQAPAPKAVLDTYARVAQAMYEDALSGARDLDKAVEAFLAKPPDAALKAAREAWLKARVPDQQTEGYRFGNKAVDDWEGRVNAWPLDEGLIDAQAANSQWLRP